MTKYYVNVVMLTVNTYQSLPMCGKVCEKAFSTAYFDSISVPIHHM